MDPCPYVRVLVGNLLIRFPNAAKSSASSSTIHPSCAPCYCKVRFSDFPSQISSIPFSGKEEQEEEEGKHGASASLAACFTLGKKQMEKIVNGSNKYVVTVEVYVGGGYLRCEPWRDKGKLLGKVRVTISPSEMVKLFNPDSAARGFSLHNGWIEIGSKAKLRLKVRVEGDPRYVFEFGGEPEKSPQVFQLQGSAKKQAVFTCKFSLRSPGDRSLTSRPSSESSTPRTWLSTLRSDRDQASKERKGWTITVHDLSGSPVAMASMVTPFVASPGSNRVSQTSPGAWLILQPSYGAWKPWGRLEAWRDRGNTVGYRFNLFNDTGIVAGASASSAVSAGRGGTFVIDTTTTVATPSVSPQSSFDFGAASPLAHFFRGFVMSSTVEKGGKLCRPVVEIGAQHVLCTEDAAAFVALAAALNLSLDACTLFTRRLRKELRRHISSSLDL